MIQDNLPQQSQNFNIHDWVRTISVVLTFIISIINLVYAIKFFRHKDKKEDDVKDKDLRVSWFKSLILDYNLEHFHKFFQEVDNELQKLKPQKLTAKAKQKIDERIKDKQTFLRKNFIDLLLAVDDNLYELTLKELDNLVDHLTELMLNSDVDLSQPVNFENGISQKIIETKTNMLKIFFDYKG